MGTGECAKLLTKRSTTVTAAKIRGFHWTALPALRFSKAAG